MVPDADHILIRFNMLKSGFLRFFEQINTLQSLCISSLIIMYQNMLKLLCLQEAVRYINVMNTFYSAMHSMISLKESVQELLFLKFRKF